MDLVIIVLVLRLGTGCVVLGLYRCSASRGELID
jgi:hypothetical protein